MFVRSFVRSSINLPPPTFFLGDKRRLQVGNISATGGVRAADARTRIRNDIGRQAMYSFSFSCR